MSEPSTISGPYSYSLFQRLRDILSVLRGLWLLLCFNALALFAFLFVSQGTDVLLSIVEDAANQYEVQPLFWLLVSLLFWSVASEFCSRVILYLSDNSGKSLPSERVAFRKAAQKWVSRILLFYPVALMIAAFFKAWRMNHTDFQIPSLNIAFVCILLCLFAFGVLIWWLYPGNGIVNIARRIPSLAWMAISPRENQWVRKLYGILNDVRVSIPASNAAYSGVDLPRGIPLPDGTTLLPEFIPYDTNPRLEKDTGLNIWMFRIPRSFYRCLIRQLLILSLLAFVFILLFSFMVPVGAYMFFGAVAMICLAFACWQIVFVALHFIDKAQNIFPFRFFLLVMFLITTFCNNDHPIRTYVPMNDARSLSLQDHFKAWLSTVSRDSTYRIGPQKKIPVVFVAAEGGALRTGAFTAMMLAKLSDSFPSFNKYIYCYSGVSGGAVGSGFYQALWIDHYIHQRHNLTYAQATDTFFKTDFLASVTGKLVFGEIINYFIPWHINRLDRAIALEQSWENGWQKIDDSINIFRERFQKSVPSAIVPALFINTTEAESGMQCIWSNVSLPDIPFNKQRDLASRLHREIAYSTAINLSSRFPLISPGAAIDFNEREKKHYVDGGYFENTGSETLFQVLKALPLKDLPIKPYVLQFNFGSNDSTIKESSIRSFSEIMEIIGGIYNTRSGRSDIAQYYLAQYVDSLDGVFIPLYLKPKTKKIPLNWMLSNTAVNRLDEEIGKMMSRRADLADSADKRQLRQLFVYQ
jgi:hypothetical protein